MCEFHDCNCNGLGDIWWTDKCMYFSSIDGYFTIQCRAAQYSAAQRRNTIQCNAMQCNTKQNNTKTMNGVMQCNAIG